MSKIVIVLIILILIVLFYIAYLQSKKPTGLFGKLMMRLWNKTYRDLYLQGFRYLPSKSNMKILDIGVGNGYSSSLLYEEFADSDILGIDLSSDAIKEANKKYKNNKLSFIQGDISNIMLNKNYYDIITAFQTHFHWNDLDTALKNIVHTLKDDGVLLIACEKNKLKYYKLDDGKLEEPCNKVGLNNIVHYSDRKYIYYVIKKQ